MKKVFIFCVMIMLLLGMSETHAERGITVKEKTGAKAASAKTFKTNYYALIIGNNDYLQLPKLKTAVSDAKEVNRVLSTKYGFKTTLLVNATRKDILSTINDYRKKLNEGDSFLIYYAGHGEYDKTADKGYWLPVDAAKDDPVDWIMAEDITSNIKRILAKHVLILSDSCYSGSLTRSAASDLGKKGERNAFLAKMMERSSRTLMASGGNEPVADAGGRGNHSVFASAVLTALQDSDKKTFTAEELFHGRVKEIVAGKSDQVPEYNNIRNSGHEGGDFIFQVAQVDDAEEETATDAGAYETPVQADPPQSPLAKGGREGNYTDPETGMEFVFVKGGCYQMGDTFGDGESDEKPVHEVCVDDYYIGKYEVTQGQWKSIRGNNPSYFSSCGDNCPVEQVSWNDIQDYIRSLNQRTGNTYRLPTEAEWEYAARSGGKSEKYSGGNDLDSVAWYDSNSAKQTHIVGQKRPNGLGIYDMTGNVWEWCQDWYGGSYYASSPKDNPQGAGSGSYRVLRGGSWSNLAKFARLAIRNKNNPDYRDYRNGFRLARTR